MGRIVRSIIAASLIVLIAPAPASWAARHGRRSHRATATATRTATRTPTATATPTPTASPTPTLVVAENAITASDAESAGTLPPMPYDPTVVQYVDPGMPTPEPPSLGPTPSPTPTPTPAAKKDPKMVALTPGQIAYRATRDASYIDPINWSVTIWKKRHQLIVYYKGRLFKTYHAVFGRSFDPGTKLWEGDRRTPEGVYAIIEKHQSRRWLCFLKLNYPNEIDRRRYEQLRDGGIVPAEDGSPIGAGGRIGIHGTDNPILNKGNVNWTTGCISVENQIIVELNKLLPVGTVVIIKP
ncbi:MAG: L,D-transpeptidase [Candidatus Binatus sp.]|uniref:L,D-transpeptidase family protein n=1 Tax=Candidatus Binatus sp. TaxID=2811406 RepID=UPI0027220B26|nr:L,D-transpeptidase [Candidatus Binatus sp.]MDO8433253.1 L,D-transpeptidase [Candidatus Binatus sp.]